MDLRRTARNDIGKIILCAAVLLVGIGCETEPAPLVKPSAPQVSPAGIEYVPRLTLPLVHRMLAAAADKADEMNLMVAIVILDSAGQPVAALRHEGKPPQVYDFAMGKARMSYMMRKPTEELGEVFHSDRIDTVFIGGDLHIAGIPGGVPLVLDGHRLGAIGVSGAKDNDDRIVAEAGKAVMEEEIRKMKGSGKDK